MKNFVRGRASSLKFGPQPLPEIAEDSNSEQVNIPQVDTFQRNNFSMNPKSRA
jgi:hypothetical protein